MQIASRMSTWGKSSKPMTAAIFDGTMYSAMEASVGEQITPSNAGSLALAWWGNETAAPASGIDPQFIRFMPSSGSIGITVAGYRNSNFCVYPIAQSIRAIPSSFNSNLIFTPQVWHHFGICFDSVNSLFSIYIDGEARYSDNDAIWLSQSANLHPAIGGVNWTGIVSLVGKVTNANMWRRPVSALEFAKLAAKISVVPTDAEHQWLFENSDGTDTGTSSTKFNLAVGSTTRFETVEWGGG